ncbi:putative sulfate exporter family transporter [Isoptericola sp. NEAU-Y5]|uniref:Sulfate exporter family transporter n=1 Tax=Isoptericola luteus TaxID=2879484 RepID=A0ABS7ZIG8_9MICO|nr:putative sulfate exporter family transporter [Isoptericola sp. NEAU-Y5]MCA5894825.1 putative sulfate exporter family transporter [Isoptericola sp. NEAU-Y5]
MTETLAPRPTAAATRAPARALPGVVLAGTAAAALLLGGAWLSAAGVTVVSPLVLALLAGAVAGSALGSSRRAGARRFTDRTAPGVAWVARHVLRAGVVLLGLQLSLPDVLDLGWRGIGVVLVTVATTFAATLALGRVLRVPRATSLLVATGFSVCGAAAVSAMTGVLERTPVTRNGGAPPRSGLRDDVAAALALVTLYGTAAVFVLPWLAERLGLDDHQAGLWLGASVQEVAQVVAAAGTVSTAALATATVAKLARVVLLAPLVAGTSAVLARRAAAAASDARAQAGARAGGGHRRRTLPVPGFVLGFLAAVMVRSLGVVPDPALDVAAHVTTALFVAAMFALGLGVDVPRLARTGRRPLLLGAASAVVVTATSLVAVLVLTP